jgi:hypothetical protein
MQVSVHDFDVKMDFGNNGIIMQVYDNNGTYRGKMRIGKARIEWCRGRTRIGNGVRATWSELIEWFESAED